MKNLTALEKLVINKIFFKLVSNESTAKFITDNLHLKDRQFSVDISDKKKCVGFYVDFLEEELSEFVPLVTHESIDLKHEKLKYGMDFILFFKDKKVVFLEGCLIDETISIELLTSDAHGFYI